MGGNSVSDIQMLRNEYFGRLERFQVDNEYL